MRTFFVLLLLSAIISGQEIKLEAENAILTGLSIATTNKGYSGTGYVTGFDNDADKITFNFTAEAALYELAIGFATPNGQKGYDLIVNSEKSTGMFPATSAFSVQTAGKCFLKAGTNSVIIGKGWGWFDVDYIKLTKSAIDSLQKPPDELSNKNSDAATRALFSFLIDMYGKKVLSGQQEMNEIEYIQSITGKTPAIGVSDLMDYSPSRIQFGANPQGIVEGWIDWAKTDGIVSLSWHWNAPTDLINQPGKEWWRGFYTDATTFDLAAAMADVNSERYKLLLRDMDAIAVQLKKFQNKKVPLLWRPLHEASGRWFWWGAKGPVPFIQLWRLMHDRFTNYHQLNNLIWVYTAGDPFWYPGDAYVDVVSLDVYTDPTSSMSGEWEGIKSLFNGKKLIALSESGTLPNADKIRSYGIWWSWFSLWTGSFIRGANTGHLRTLYADKDIITRDELPDWRQLYDNSQDDSSFALQVYPNPCIKSTTIAYSIPETSVVELKLYDVLGKMVQSVNLPVQEPGQYTYSLNTEKFPAGVYFVKLKAKGIESKGRFVVLK